jgi:malonyl-CoA/methylmalonyl-CoA synthetase
MRDNLFARVQEAMPGATSPFLDTATRRYSYGDLDRISAALGHRLQALGVRKGDRVAAQVEKSPQAVFLYLACLRTGAVYLPLNTGYTLRELDYFFGDAEPRVIVCDPAKESEVDALAGTRAAVVTLPISHLCLAIPTISRRCSTPRAPPAAPRARC